MDFNEKAAVFECDGDLLIGVLSIPERLETDTGVLVIVGGPQYRGGSHRQFISLCRQLAAQGIPCLRFDYRGMGDSTGAQRSFDQVDTDIKAALDTFVDVVPDARRFLLWGLCDGASAACLYAPKDARVSGLVLVNPWVRTEATRARTYLRHYYLARLFDARFWRKLWSGHFNPRRALAEVRASVRDAATPIGSAATDDCELLPVRMAASLRKTAAHTLVILSGRDYVAREFEEAVRTYRAWGALKKRMEVVSVPEADHTFSSAEWKTLVATITYEWIKRTA